MDAAPLFIASPILVMLWHVGQTVLEQPPVVKIGRNWTGTQDCQNVTAFQAKGFTHIYYGDHNVPVSVMEISVKPIILFFFISGNYLLTQKTFLSKKMYQTICL